MITAIVRKNARRHNSLKLALNVWPKICNPYEWRDNFRMRKTRTNLTILRIIIVLTLLVKARDMKYGIIAHKSIQFMIFLKNFPLFGDTIILSITSKENHVTHKLSITNRILCCMELRSSKNEIVSRQNVHTDTTMKSMDRNAYI